MQNLHCPPHSDVGVKTQEESPWATSACWATGIGSGSSNTICTSLLPLKPIYPSTQGYRGSKKLPATHSHQYYHSLHQWLWPFNLDHAWTKPSKKKTGQTWLWHHNCRGQGLWRYLTSLLKCLQIRKLALVLKLTPEDYDDSDLLDYYNKERVMHGPSLWDPWKIPRSWQEWNW